MVVVYALEREDCLTRKDGNTKLVGRISRDKQMGHVKECLEMDGTKINERTTCTIVQSNTNRFYLLSTKHKKDLPKAWI